MLRSIAKILRCNSLGERDKRRRKKNVFARASSNKQAKVLTSDSKLHFQ